MMTSPSNESYQSLQSPFVMQDDAAEQKVNIVGITWARDSHDLFDYEANQVNIKKNAVANSFKILRHATELSYIPDNVEMDPEAEYLARIVFENGHFWVHPADKATLSHSPRKLWLVVRDMAPKGHSLQEGDVIKLGRHKLRVRQLVADRSDVQPDISLDDQQACRSYFGRENEDLDLSQIPCRICLLDGASEEEPLVNPCSCTGSIKFVHLACLRYWISGRLNLTDGQGVAGTYFYRQLNCELCHTPYPAYVTSYEPNLSGDPEVTPLVQVPPTKPPFVVLENLVRDAPSNSQQAPPHHAGRGLHVISLAENKAVKLGRGHESDIRIADVSISRCHAVIRYVDGEFLLEDHTSKFGTLVALRRPQMVDPEGSLSVQIGRTVLSLCLQSALEQDAPAVGQWTKRVNTSQYQSNESTRDRERERDRPPVPPGFDNPLQAYMAAAQQFQQDPQHTAAMLQAMAANLAQRPRGADLGLLMQRHLLFPGTDEHREGGENDAQTRAMGQAHGPPEGFPNSPQAGAMLERQDEAMEGDNPPQEIPADGYGFPFLLPQNLDLNTHQLMLQQGLFRVPPAQGTPANVVHQLRNMDPQEYRRAFGRMDRAGEPVPEQRNRTAEPVEMLRNRDNGSPGREPAEDLAYQRQGEEPDQLA